MTPEHRGERPAELFELHQRPTLEDPVLVVGLEGWVDAGFAAASAMTFLLEQIDAEPVATFDADLLVDHRSRRPIMHLVDGINTDLTWPLIELRAAPGQLGRDLLVLVGAEPDYRWRAFSTAVVDLALELGVGLMVGLGAYPAPVPHTRPSRLAASATTPALAERADVRATLDVPAAAGGAIERRCAEAGVPAIGLWAQVPHYASAMGYPAASALLLERLADLADLRLDVSALHEAAASTRSQLDDLVADSDEHQELIQRLESAVDADVRGERLPSGDELAAELERFLREQGRGDR